MVRPLNLPRVEIDKFVSTTLNVYEKVFKLFLRIFVLESQLMTVWSLVWKTCSLKDPRRSLPYVELTSLFILVRLISDSAQLAGNILVREGGGFRIFQGGIYSVVLLISPCDLAGVQHQGSASYWPRNKLEEVGVKNILGLSSAALTTYLPRPRSMCSLYRRGRDLCSQLTVLVRWLGSDLASSVCRL